VKVPRQNRPLVRDGRIQAKKKRTDRSYLRPAPEPEAVPEEPIAEEEPQDAADVVRAAVEAAAEPAPSMPEPTAAFAPPEPAAEPSAPVPFQRTPSGKLPTAVRAIQQQGVRKRRDFDIQALALRDTKYAMHELRRIAILATMVVVTLIVLGVVMR
jgi:hypothetical protein